MQSQGILLQSKDDAMRALNQRVFDLEKKSQLQTKELTTLKTKAQEEKDQLFAEARAHERAKQQMATLITQLQDKEKELR
jgi:hypothetical protein